MNVCTFRLSVAGRLAEIKGNGAVRNLFNEVGTITARVLLNDKPVTLELAEEHAIEVEAQEVEIIDEEVRVRDLYRMRGNCFYFIFQ